ncbi:MAG: hypothetical protein IT337_04830 [Thermomicrobiales bacterium]|nr:hypothetical protein [Thermomicrobiales bacterium]
MWRRSEETDSGWIGAGADDDLDRRMADEDVALDLAQPHVMTALGPIEPGALGVTLAGEPIADLFVTDAGERTAIDPKHALLAELADAHAIGVRSLVVSGGGIGGAVLPGVRWLAERIPVHVVVLHRVDFAGPDSLLEPDEAHSFTWGGLEVTTEAVRQGAAKALARNMRATGLAARIHADRADDAVDAVIRLRNAGVDVSRIWVGNLDWVVASAAAAQVLNLGATIAFDRLLGDSRQPVATLVGSLVEAGWADRLLFSSGAGHADQLRVRGHPTGIAMALDVFPLVLMDAGVAAQDVRRGLIDNPARLLTIHGEDR